MFTVALTELLPRPMPLAAFPSNETRVQDHLNPVAASPEDGVPDRDVALLSRTAVAMPVLIESRRGKRSRRCRRSCRRCPAQIAGRSRLPEKLRSRFRDGVTIESTAPLLA